VFALNQGSCEGLGTDVSPSDVRMVHSFEQSVSMSVCMCTHIKSRFVCVFASKSFLSPNPQRVGRKFVIPFRDSCSITR
jgi:hypothetical protein